MIKVADRKCRQNTSIRICKDLELFAKLGMLVSDSGMAIKDR
jgi:hypothetical protein